MRLFLFLYISGPNMWWFPFLFIRIRQLLCDVELLEMDAEEAISLTFLHKWR